MKKVSIITRAHNRLEYTIQCISTVRRNTRWENYEHLIINNNSVDGTREWLGWVETMPKAYYPKIKSIHLDKNMGDWGGMLAATPYIDSDYIVQLDNDIAVPKGWLTSLVNVLEESGAGVVTLKRTGVQQVIEAKNIRTIAGEECGDIPFNVACYITSTENWEKHSPHILNCRGLTNRIGWGCIKIIGKLCHQMEGWNGETYIQHDKY